MTRRIPLILLLVLVTTAQVAYAGPRDAAAVLNRCGKPLKGEEIILEDTVAGGRRILKYERGNLTFNKVANIGWTFSYGTHKKEDHLTADEMEKYMPCLKDALADSAAPEPLVRITPIDRAEVSVKRSYKKLILCTLAALLLIGIAFFVWSRRSRTPEDQDDDSSEV